MVNPALTSWEQSRRCSQVPAGPASRRCGIPATGSQEAAADRPENVAMPRFFRLIAALKRIQCGRASTARPGKRKKMAARGLLVVLFGVGVVLGGCMQSTLEPASEANLTPRDKKLLAAAPYEKATIPEPYQAPHRRISPQGSARHDPDRFRRALSLLRAARRQGDPLRRHRRRRSAGLVGRGQSRPHDRMADLDADRRDQEAHGRAGLRRPRPAKSDGRARACICSRATRTRSTASTAPTSRNISARRFPRAASA